MDECSTPARYELRPSDSAVDDVFRRAESDPDHPAARRWDGTTWVPVTGRALADDVRALAAGLVCSGIEAGQRVGLMSRTRYEWMVFDQAVMSVGAVTVPIYETSSAEQVEWILGDAGAVAVMVETAEHEALVESVRERLPGLAQVWTLERDHGRLVEAGLAVDDATLATRRHAIRCDDLATIVYTSGTTGRPKGCMLTHGNLVAMTENVSRADDVTEMVFNDEQTTLLFLPLAHILARIIQACALHAGVTLGHTADMRQLPDRLQSFRPTTVLSVPRVFEKIYNTAAHTAAAAGRQRVFARAEAVAIAASEARDRGEAGLRTRLEHAVLDRLVYARLRAAMGGRVRWAVSGGAPLGARLGHFFRGLGVTVLEGYGLTETTAGGTLNLPRAQRVGSVGRPIPGCGIRIAPDGEILMRGPHVFVGYWNNEAATKEVLDADGWFRTGDIGHLDDEGYLFITDRKKDLIVTAAGKNVAPSVLEDRLRAHWLVSQAVVVGDRRPYVAALLTLDDEAFRTWKAERGKPSGAGVEALGEDADLLAVVQAAVDEANAAVSQAEAIKRWRLLPADFSEESGQLTPTLKMRRNVVMQEYAAEVEALYG